LLFQILGRERERVKINNNNEEGGEQGSLIKSGLTPTTPTVHYNLSYSIVAASQLA